MRIGILGTGMVAGIVGTKLVRLGHDVRLGSRTPDNPRAVDWVARLGSRASAGNYAEAAAFGTLVVNATAGQASLAALHSAGAHRLAGKIIIDVANPLDLSDQAEAKLTVANTDSLGEQIQRAFPGARVVKTLNTMSATVMVDPSRVDGAHTVFLSGDDGFAKDVVTGLLRDIGWPAHSVVDLGDISTARGTEMLAPIGWDLWKALGTADFNFHVQRARTALGR